ncbi:TRAP transporter large permease [Roseibium porphyridii]|uniref:TRAP transporter large permease protein n=1 Tax=Roseibium porphyridii TaxID=2866279 RepID=A0ABY8F301_9HYPH|nr:TRAP transporter large permease [Roseibium sp. KMA01]WFE89860.1 TRAP transporter large permease [Roseibium sp. KMA01]
MTALALLAGAFFVLLLLGVPIVFALIAACIVVLTQDGLMSAQLVMQRVYAGIDSFPLLAIPFFLLAGKLMEAGGITRRLIGFAFHLVGWIRGGLAHVAVLAATMFAGVSGSSVADTAAIGSTIIPRMKERGYDPSYSASVVAASGVIGSTIPPSIPLVLYGVISGVSIGGLFMGGIIPGVLMCLGLMGYIYFSAKPAPSDQTVSATQQRSSFASVFLQSLPALLLPGIIVGGIRTGAFSATEAAAVAVAYAFLIGVAYRELRLSQVPEILYQTARDTTLVMAIVGAASLVGYVLTIEQIPFAIAEWFTDNVNHVLVLLLLVNLLLLIAGCFLDGGSAIIVFTPVLLPVIKAFGIDPLFFGVLMSINLMIGTITPPVGLSLYVAGGIANVKIGRMMRAILPFLCVHLALLCILMVFPQLVTAIPSLVYNR